MKNKDEKQRILNKDEKQKTFSLVLHNWYEYF